VPKRGKVIGLLRLVDLFDEIAALIKNSKKIGNSLSMGKEA